MSWKSLDMAGHGFYELSTLRHEQVVRAVYDGSASVAGTIEVQGRRRRVEMPVHLHLLLHRSGIVVLRPTVRFDEVVLDGELGGPAAVDLPTVLAIERALWWPDADLRWFLDGVQIAHGWGRGPLNYLFLQLFDAWSGRRRSVEDRSAAARESATGCNELHDLHRKGVLHHPFPVTFGAEIQFLLPKDESESENEWGKRADVLAAEALPPLTTGVAVLPRDVEDESVDVGWYFDENRALVIREYCPLHAELDVFDAERTQLVEFLTVRRAALSCVRRASQISLMEREPITREEIEDWHHLVTTTTDDYVVDARIGSLLESVRHTFARDPRLRSIDALEAQVRRNLDALQMRIDSASERSGGLVAALFGGGALVLGLQSALQLVLAVFLGVGSADVPRHYAGLLALSQVLLIAVSFVVVYLVIRRPTRVLRSRGRRRRRRRLPAVRANRAR